MEHWTKQEFARRVAVDAAATPTAHDIKRTGLAHVAGQHLSAAANEPEPEPEWDRGPLTMPAELTEADWDAADRAEDQGKGARRNALRDRIALEDQVQHLRLIGGL